ncbi:tyrosine-type recombinase/integrase [Bradyrhizobium liaoningense]
MAELHRLTPAQVRDAKPGDKLADGGGLRLDVDKNGNRNWIFRFKSPVSGKERYQGLGSAADVTLTRARSAAQASRDLIRQGKDPLHEKAEARETARIEAAKAIAFEEFAKQYVATHKPGWKNVKHAQQWENTLRDYVYPVIGSTSVPSVTTDDVVKVLEPIWLTKKETAARIRGRIEKIMDAAKAKKLRTGDNPALLGIIRHLLPAQKRKQSVVHHPSLPYEEMPKFWKSLATDDTDAAKMLRFIVLTACRFNEAAKMDPAAEVKDDLWTIPAGRTKSERIHYVPLTKEARALLPFRPVSDVSLAKCIARHSSTPATTHGMRSTFRDWAGDETEAAWEVAEAALAHATGNDTEIAYQRRTALAKRRELMGQWAAYCNQECVN